MKLLYLLTLLSLPLAAFAAPPDHYATTPAMEFDTGYDTFDLTDALVLDLKAVVSAEAYVAPDPVDGFAVPTGEGFAIHRPGIDQNGKRRSAMCSHPSFVHPSPCYRARDAI